MKKVYFARFGKVFGPFGEDELEALQARGRLKEFSWMWDAVAGRWQPMDAAPPPLPEALAAASGLTGAEGLSAVLHNRRSFLSGALEGLTETGCAFITDQGGATPPFGAQAPVLLNLLNAGTGQAVNVTAQVCGVQRRAGRWQFELRWEGRPQI